MVPKGGPAALRPLPMTVPPVRERSLGAEAGWEYMESPRHDGTRGAAGGGQSRQRKGALIPAGRVYIRNHPAMMEPEGRPEVARVVRGRAP